MLISSMSPKKKAPNIQMKTWQNNDKILTHPQTHRELLIHLSMQPIDQADKISMDIKIWVHNEQALYVYNSTPNSYKIHILNE